MDPVPILFVVSLNKCFTLCAYYFPRLWDYRNQKHQANILLSWSFYASTLWQSHTENMGWSKLHYFRIENGAMGKNG